MSYNDVKHSEIQNAEHGCTIPGEHTRAMCGAPAEQMSLAEEVERESQDTHRYSSRAENQDGATTDW